MFDGVHRGHRMLFERVFEEAKRLQARSAVVTFDPHPLEILAPSKAPCILTTIDQRIGLFEEAGFDVALVLPFNRDLAALSPLDFAREALVEELHVRKVLVGEDFRFGHDRAGNVATLAEIGKSEGFEAEAVGLLGGDEGKISSSDVRLLLREGLVEAAASLLGRGYRLAGEVIHGDERGRTLGFPTANIAPSTRACLPALGVYAGWWCWNEKRLPSAINVGVRPTFKEQDAPLTEVYVLDFDGDLYGAHGEVEFTARLRSEEKFDSVEALVAKMQDDVRRTRELVGGR
jgi:riboflavin kinase/FMN adenylyltransferase